MSAKFSQTRTEFLPFAEATLLLRKLYEKEEYQKSLLISIGIFWGLRISDILNLKYSQILNKDEVVIVEKKTKKTREIKINTQLKKHISACIEKLNPYNIDDFIFKSQKGTVYSIQRINVILKEIKVEYNLKIKNFSSHSLRKTFGREVFNQSEKNSELALIKLSQIFGHSNPSVTKIYLGITKQEIMDTYDLLSF